ncbi:MAG: AAA family ATPase, partial [Nitrospirae bacterium]|nr:AAA family ATPase [Nitrospirota bacterium]
MIKPPPRSLLGLFLTHPGRSFSFDEAMEAVWPHLDPDAGSKSLRAAVSKLRKVLEPDLHQGRLSKYIRTEPTGYAFTAPPQCILDVDEVNRTFQEGKKLHDLERWNEALTHYQKTLSIYRGDFLADEPEAEWLFPCREHWRDIRNDTLLAQSKCHLSLGQYSSAIEACRTLLEKNRSHEAAYRTLMLGHYLSGHLNDVAILFKQCREALQSELGVEPSEETVRLYDQILRRRVPGIDKTVRSPITVSRSQRAPHSLGRLQFIGREKEVGLLVAHLEAALQKRGSIVAIGGESGIGKTRLADEILVYAKAGSFLTAGGRCYSPPLRRPYEPFAEIFRQILKGRGREQLLSLSPFWLSCLPRIVPEIPLPGNTPALPPIAVDQEKQRLFEAVSRLLIDLSEQTPLALLLDDLHWADDETLEALHYVTRRISRERILILATYHPESVSSHPLLSQFLSEIQRVSSRKLSLSHLSGRTLVDLFQKMSAKGESPERMERLALRIFDETQGNPLFVVELLQTLLEKGVLKVNPRGKWTASEGGDEGSESLPWEIPQGIRQVILSRLERVDPDCRICLGILSTLDRGFTKDLLGKLVEPEGPEATLALDECLRLGFLHEDPDLRGVYRFVHENIRKTVYDQLRFREKKEFHFRAARVLESEAASGAGAQELAHHFLLAEKWPQTFKYLVAAAESTHRTY